MDINNNTIEVKSHSSKIIGLIPSHLHEPIALIAKIKGFESIDDYVIDVIKRELESLREGGHAAADFGESIADYLQNMIPDPSSPANNSIKNKVDSVDEEDEWMNIKVDLSKW